MPAEKPAEGAERQLILDGVVQHTGVRTLWNHPVHVLPVAEWSRSLHVSKRTATLIILMLQLPPLRHGPWADEQRHSGAVGDAAFVPQHAHTCPRRRQTFQSTSRFVPLEHRFGRSGNARGADECNAVRRRIRHGGPTWSARSESPNRAHAPREILVVAVLAAEVGEIDVRRHVGVCCVDAQ